MAVYRVTARLLTFWDPPVLVEAEAAAMAARKVLRCPVFMGTGGARHWKWNFIGQNRGEARVELIME
jgi:hypothetical protein